MTNFDIDQLQSDLDVYSGKFDEMGILFRMIRKLSEEGNNDHAIKRLADLGQYVCEDWCNTVDICRKNLNKHKQSNSTKEPK